MRIVVSAAAILVMAACAAPSEPAPSPSGLLHTFESTDALAAALLDRLARNDLEGLRALGLCEQEFRDHVWPELPASRPERNIPFDYAWQQMKQRSDGHLAGTLARYGGQRLRLVRTRHAGETTQYASFAVVRDSEIIAADDQGRQLVLTLYGSTLVQGGRYKLFSYVVDR